MRAVAVLRNCLAALCLLSILTPATVLAQELSPRSYWPAPKGTQVLTLGMVHVSGDIIPDPSLPLSGLDSSIDTYLLGYLRTISLFGRTSNLIIEVPYSDGETKVDHDELGKFVRDYNGLGDITATLSVNLLGAPSLDLKGFADLRRNPRPILGASIRVVAPTGDYDEDRVINVGANRWATKAELGYMMVLSPKWLLEMEAGVWLFGDNDDFVGMTKEQEPLSAFELHLVRRFRPGMWLSLDANGYKGGRSKLDGRRLDDLQRDSKLGLTFSYPLPNRSTVRLGYSFGSVNDSDEDFHTVSLSYNYLF